MKALDLPPKRRRGNPERGAPLEPANVLLTEFEALVTRLRLSQEQYASPELRYWCERHSESLLCPEWLLKKWRTEVEDIFSAID